MKKLAAWWFAPAPAERLAAVRILVGGFALAWVAGRLAESYAVARLPATHFAPTGVVRLLAAPLSPSVALAIGVVTSLLLLAFVLGAWFRVVGPLAIGVATSLLLLAFVLGAWFRVVGPLAALGLLWTLTYRNSWGMVFHTENLLVLHVIVLALAPSADAWSLDARRGAPPAPTGYGWVLKLLVAITVVTYVLAGVAKLRLAGTGWLDGAQLRNHIALDNLRKALLGDTTAPLATPFLDHPAWFTVFSLLTFVLELGAPIALVGGRPARWWAFGAWSFHVGVILLMNIWFPYPLLGLAYVPILRAERPFAWAIARWRRRRAARE